MIQSIIIRNNNKRYKIEMQVRYIRFEELGYD